MTFIDITQASQDRQRIQVYDEHNPLAERIDDAFGVFFSGKRKPDDTDKLLMELKRIIESELDKTIKEIENMLNHDDCILRDDYLANKTPENYCMVCEYLYKVLSHLRKDKKERDT